MKVIQKGRPQKGWSKQYDCTGKGNKNGGCGAVLLVEWRDLFVTTSSCAGEVERCLTFKCVECGVLTDVDVYDPPDFDKIPDKRQWDSMQESSSSAFGY